MAYNNTCDFHVVSILIYFYNIGTGQEHKASNFINISLSIPTAFLNILVLIAILRKPSLRTSSNVFLCNLACSDLCIALITEPSTAIIDLTGLYTNCEAFFSVILLSCSLGVISFLTIFASTVDRYLTLKLHLRYSSQITTPVVLSVCAFIWFLGFIVAAVLIISKIGVLVILVAAVLQTLVIFFCYVQIFGVLRRHCNQIQAQMSSLEVPNIVNVLLVKKTVSNLVCVIILYLVSYAPFAVCSAILFTLEDRASIQVVKLWLFAINIVCVNSLVNPLIYCWRMAEIRNAIKETFELGFAKIRDCFQRH